MNIWAEIPFQFKTKTGVGNYFITIESLIKEQVDSYKRISVEHKFFNVLKFRSLQTKFWMNGLIYARALLQRPHTILFMNIVSPKIKSPNSRYVSAIYDLNYFNPDYVQGKVAEGFIKNTNDIITHADQVLTISDTIKQEILERYNIKEDRIKVIYPSFDKSYQTTESNPDIIEKYNISRNQYILSVATLNKRKNLPALIEAFEGFSQKHPTLKLVLVGGMGNDKQSELTQNKNIIFTGYIPDEELPTLYQNALMYVFPSLYEGFGIPILEAQASKTPVICSDIPVFREVGAESVLYCDPTPEGISQKMDELVNNPKLAQELILKGEENINRFSEDVLREQVKEFLEL
jgi:glycosyltransferase involved in cell wall biosynthesis